MDILFIISILLGVIAAALLALAGSIAYRIFVLHMQGAALRQAWRAALDEPLFGILAVGEYKVLDGDGSAKYFKTASGTGATGDAWVPLHSVDDNGGSLTVDVGTALPAGTNAIGKLAANSGVDIGDVDITSIAAGTNNIGDVDVLTIAAGDNNIGNVDIVTLPNVTVGAALPAGTNAIGKLAANSGVDIGDVDVTSIAAGDNNIGNVDVVTLPALVAGTANIGDVDVLTLPVIIDANVVSITITRPADTTAYAAGDAVTDSTSAPTAFSATGFARATGGSGRITSITLIDSSLVSPAANLELWIFDTAYTPNNDNAAFAPSDANANQLVGLVSLGGNPIAGTLNAIYNAQGLDIPYLCLTTTTLWFALVVRNAYVPTSAEVFKLRMGVERYG